jgi:hypothetical protein
MSTNIQPPAANPEPAQSGQLSARAASERVNVILSPLVLDWLDAVVADIHGRTGNRVNRSEILRAVMGAFAARRVTFRWGSEEEIRRAMDAYLERASRAARVVEKQ